VHHEPLVRADQGREPVSLGPGLDHDDVFLGPVLEATEVPHEGRHGCADSARAAREDASVHGDPEAVAHGMRSITGEPRYSVSRLDRWASNDPE
jgi:hypothetical protein